jgi:Arc/MetJ-type ribon-helix-helix transcriptional regulator
MDNTKRPRLSFNLSTENHAFINQLVYTKIVKGELKYSFSEAIKEGLLLLQFENSEIPKRLSLERRYYKGGKQEKKKNMYKTSILSSEDINDWIEDYINFKIENNLPFFRRSNVIEEAVELLFKKYKNKLLQVPKPVID